MLKFNDAYNVLMSEDFSTNVSPVRDESYKLEFDCISSIVKDVKVLANGFNGKAYVVKLNRGGEEIYDVVVYFDNDKANDDEYNIRYDVKSGLKNLKSFKDKLGKKYVDGEIKFVN